MMGARAQAACLGLLLCLAQTATALSSWYTPPGGPPTGSTAGDKVRGVNLGGWLILENWMMPSLFAVPPLDQHNVPDEWTYCEVLGKDECLKRLEQHWDKYLVEDDFKRFSNYSLNTVRIPMGYWSWTDPEWFEPYIQGQLPYLERALNWSSVYGLDVMMDLHGLPGGQNGQDNQGYKGPVEFQNNATNMERAMVALANMTKFVTQEKWGGVVKAIELTNEPYIQEYNPNGMNFYDLAEFYVQGYAAVRASENILAGAKEVMVVIHDAFQPLLNWKYFWSEPSLGLNWTNYALDTHIYDAFGGSMNKTNQEHLDTICSISSSLQAAQLEFPVIIGEFSLGTKTYCVDYQSCFGKSIYDLSWDSFTQDQSMFLRQFWEVQQDVYELAAGWIFWSYTHELAAPWSWGQSAAQNWIPEDPSEKIWPFDAHASSYCLDTANPIDGDQNMPKFPTYANNVSNIKIDTVVGKKGVGSLSNAANGSATAAGTSASVSASSAGTSASASGAAASPSASKASSAPAVRQIGGGVFAAVGAILLGALASLL